MGRWPASRYSVRCQDDAHTFRSETQVRALLRDDQGDREPDMEPAVLSGEAPSFVSQLSGSIRRPSQILAAAVRGTPLDVSTRHLYPRCSRLFWPDCRP